MQAFTPMEYYGTNYSNASPVNSSECVNGFDSAAYIAGTSLSAVNLWLAEYYSNGTVGQFSKRQNSDSSGGKLPYPENEAVIEQMRVADGTAPFIEGELPEILGAFGNLSIEEGLYGLVSNPFYGIKGDGSKDEYGITNDYITEGAGEQEYLFLVDGSEGGQVNPIWPVIQPERGVDFIIVSDNSGTELSSGWMNGTTFKITSDTAIKAGIPFPKVPSVNTMLNKNYTSQPTFFGCNEAADVPLVLYIADAPYTSYSNISLVLDSITDGQLELIWQNGFTSMTQDRNALRENWSDCLACGVIHKSIMKMRLMLPEVCQTCMRDYCWQGDEDDSQPSFLAPYPRLNQTLSWAEWNATVWSKA
jgi:lysophospholipase